VSLQSKLFKGDHALEACLIHDAAHVTPGAVGGHVGKIQTALATIDGLIIDPAELGAHKYGATTAAAVLSFKKKRKIINWSYQTECDDIVGKMTITALDQEMRGRDGPPDTEGLALCKYTDGTPTDRSNLRLGFAVSWSPAPAPPFAPPLPPPPHVKTPLEHALEVVQTAKDWVTSAVGWLSRVKGFYQKYGNSNWPADALALFEAVNVHFHLRQLPSVDKQPPQLQTLITNYNNILTILNNQDMMGDDPTIYTDKNDPRFGCYATAKIGGFGDATVTKKIWLHGLFLSAPGVKCRCAIMIHECAHSVAPGYHYAYGHPRSSGGTAGEPFAKGVVWPRNYAGLTADEAAHNADTYATFAAHASTHDPTATGDIRPGAHDVNT
jgi:hypothetical protein